VCRDHGHQALVQGKSVTYTSTGRLSPLSPTSPITQSTALAPEIGVHHFPLLLDLFPGVIPGGNAELADRCLTPHTFDRRLLLCMTALADPVKVFGASRTSYEC